MTSRLFFATILFFTYSPVLALPSDSLPKPLTVPAAKRPAWVREQGIVMAGSWESLVYRVRRDNYDNKDHSVTPEQRRLYEMENSQQMLDQLKKLGVNFVMTHCYKAFGFEAERQGMEDAAKLSALCHKNGMNVGVYLSSGTLGWEKLRQEIPQSKDWELLDANGQPILFGTMYFRHFFNRNNPEVQAYLHKLIDFAINDIKTDLLHFDNYSYGAAYDRLSIERFREYMKRHLDPAEVGVSSFDSLMPPRKLEPTPDSTLNRAWLDFCCQSLAESFYHVSSYARSVRPSVLVECNTCEFGDRISVPTDHGRIYRYGEAFWDEGIEPSYKDGQLTTRQIIYKTGQTMDNIVFVYIRDPLQAAESLAYNTDCLGCICQFEYGKITVPSGEPVPRQVNPDILPYVKFFHEQRPYYRDIERVWDVGVLRSFPSQRFGPDYWWQNTNRFERHCIEGRVPWTLVFDHNLSDLNKFRALCLVGANALSESQVLQILKYVHKGGGLILTDETGMHDEKLHRRSESPFNMLKGPRIVRVKADVSREEALTAMRTACGGPFFVLMDAPRYVLTELTDQKERKRRFVHLVNYSPGSPVADVKVDVESPANCKVKRVALIRPESPKRKLLTFRQDSGRVKFTVPRIDVYGLISIES
ncbi:MAG: hypothetical protein HYX78_04585 [Armatimonadetes bacterium]|nr:hypothetical protein [Armatimonadota bacterium]